MAKFTVTIVDTTGIQPYVFGSNRLQENIGASELVRLATEEWALEAVKDVASSHNLKLNRAGKVTGELDDDFKIDRIDKVTEIEAAEVIYCGGGNTVILFSQPRLARDYAWTLTSKTLKEAPGLSLVISHNDSFDWDESSNQPHCMLSNIVTGLLNQEVAAHKASRLPSLPMLGLGVTAACQSTGLVAVRMNGIGADRGLRMSTDEPTQLISREIAAKLSARNPAMDNLNARFEQEADRMQFPADIDKLGRIKGEDSYVAVVHADGNGMGERIEKIATAHPTSKGNRPYIKAIRNFSRAVKKASTAALRDTIKALTDSVKEDDDGIKYVAGRVPLEGEYLPFRPLVFGGDDLTFVCNGHLGISLATTYLDAYEKRTKEQLNGETLYASAGIAIVKMHYPFARAYALSEELAKSAKGFVREKHIAAPTASALDWHIATSGLSGSYETIRRIEYERPDVDDKETKRTLLLRPVLLRFEQEAEARCWLQVLKEIVDEFQKGPQWKGRRNKVKDLREVLREGLYAKREDIRKPLDDFRRNHDLPELPRPAGLSEKVQKEGWGQSLAPYSYRCGYFDAIELCDYYVELTRVSKKAQEDQA